MKGGKLLIACLIVFASACQTNKQARVYDNIPGYDLTDPVVIQLNPALDEISGIVYYPKDSSIFAINDELGVLYKIYIRHQVKVDKWKFGEDGDYEDIALVNKTFYALKSNGDIKCFTFVSKDSLQVDDCQVPVFGDNEFEALYYDSSTARVNMVCKTCSETEDNASPVYAFNPADQTFLTEPALQLNFGNSVPGFKPSAAAIHPITNHLFVVSSNAKALAVFDKKKRLKEIYQLDPALFKQPEGITFTPSGDLLISNEAAGIGSPTVLVFPYKPVVDEED